MRKLWPLLLLVAGVAVAGPRLAPLVLKADFPVFPDGGSTVTSIDGGTTPVTVDLMQTKDWNMVIRCEGAQSTRYKLCISASCTPNAANLLLDSDRTYDIPVTQGNTDKYRYLGLATDDGGTPLCKVYTTTPP